MTEYITPPVIAADLPASPSNLAAPRWPLRFYHKLPPASAKAISPIRGDLTLRPNALADFAVKYDMAMVSQAKIEDEGLETQHFFARASVWQGVRKP